MLPCRGSPQKAMRRETFTMTEHSLERIMSNFRGDRSREVDREDFIDALADVLGLSLLKDAARAGDNRERPPSVSYSTNEGYWMDSLMGRHREGSSVRLEGFHITEWTPCSPGRYYTPEAAQARERAKQFLSWTGNEYLPLGKESMMLGGVGSVRLKGRTIDGQQYYFLGTSSTGITHQGIPLIVPESQHSRVVDVIIQSGGCYANITGQMRVMPSELSLISYSQNVPKYFLLAQSVEPIEPSPANVLLGTASVMYSGSYYGHSDFLEMDGFSTQIRKGWTFCSFNPSDGIQAIMAAAEWLRDYAGRYSGEGGEPLLSDFDEHHQHFENPIEFPIGRIVDRTINLERLQVYGGHYGFQIIAKEVNVGNVFSNISNSTIINESEVRDSFYKIAREQDEATANALLQVAEEIERSGNTGAGALFHTFNTELQKDDSNKTVLKAIWDGIVGQLPHISTMVGVVEKVGRLFG